MSTVETLFKGVRAMTRSAAGLQCVLGLVAGLLGSGAWAQLPIEIRRLDEGGGVVHPIRVVPAEYTEAARRARISGPVTLEVLVQPDGRVAEVEVVRPLPMGLALAAEKAVRAWLFAPTPSVQRVRIEMEFAATGAPTASEMTSLLGARRWLSRVEALAGFWARAGCDGMAEVISASRTFPSGLDERHQLFGEFAGSSVPAVAQIASAWAGQEPLAASEAALLRSTEVCVRCGLLRDGKERHQGLARPARWSERRALRKALKASGVRSAMGEALLSEGWAWVAVNWNDEAFLVLRGRTMARCLPAWSFLSPHGCVLIPPPPRGGSPVGRPSAT